MAELPPGSQTPESGDAEPLARSHPVPRPIEPLSEINRYSGESLQSPDPLDEAPPHQHVLDLTIDPPIEAPDHAPGASLEDQPVAVSSERSSTGGGRTKQARRNSTASIDAWHTVSPWPPKPGVFVALWPAFLLVGCLLAAAPFIAARYVDTLIVDGTIRGLLCAFAVGLCVLMPLVRLSQSRSSRPMLESAMDAFSLLLPLQPLIWFAVVKPVDWRMDRILAIDIHLIIHAALVAFASGITLAHEPPGTAPDRPRRTLAMAGIVSLQFIPLAAYALLNAVGVRPPESLTILSGVGGVIQLAGTPYEPVRLADWLGLLGLANIVAASWWIGAFCRGSVKHQRGAQADGARTAYSSH